MAKTCDKHDQEKFQRRGSDGRIRWICRKCESENTSKRRSNLIQEARDALGGNCIDCNMSEQGALVFHHINPVHKSSPVARIRSRKKMFMEIKQCELLCEVCHRIRHAKEVRAKEHPEVFKIRWKSNKDGTLLCPIHGYSPYGSCKLCVRTITNTRNRIFKRVFIDFMGSSCHVCSLTSAYEEVYDFHHVEPERKSFSIGNMRYSFSNLDMILDELAKCCLLCANCHMLTYNDNLLVEHGKIDADNAVSILREKMRDTRKTLPAEKTKCGICGKECQGSRCKSCYVPAKKISWPGTEEVVQMVLRGGYRQAGIELGVSDNAVRKFLLRNGVDPLPKRRI